MNVFERDKEYIANTYNRFPVCITHGKGSLLYGDDGKEYIDLGAGIAVNTFGTADEEWLAAVTKQLGLFAHTSNLYYSEPCTLAAEMLCKRTGMKKVFFSNSGAEANECAIKAARRYAEKNKGAEYYNIITLEKSFHGRTLTTLAATGQEAFHKDFRPLTPGFVYTPANDAAALEKTAAENKCAAIMIEIVQGEGGVNALDADFVKAVFETAEKHGLLVITDEVQCGSGRTGELFGYMNYGVKPDIVTTAKGLAGGLPIGATLLGERAENIFEPGLHGSTFGGNPVSCSGAVNVLSRLTDCFLESVRGKGGLVRSMLSGAEGFESVSGMMRYAFERLGARRIIAEVNARNTRSLKLVERLGMRKEAHFREYMPRKENSGIYDDLCVFAVLKNEI